MAGLIFCALRKELGLRRATSDHGSTTSITSMNERVPCTVRKVFSVAYSFDNPSRNICQLAALDCGQVLNADLKDYSRLFFQR